MTLPLNKLVRLQGAFVALILVSWLAGCAQVYTVKVDSLRNRSVEAGHSYRIVSRDPALPETDPNYAQAEKLVKDALSRQGMYEAENPGEAEVVVEIDYGVGPLRQRVRNSEETLGESIIGPDLTRLKYASENQKSELPDGLESVETHEKRLSISAREARPAESDGGGKAREIWRVEAVLEDEKDRIDRALPVLAEAAAAEIGQPSEQKQVKRITVKG